MNTLTSQQENFAQAVVAGKNASDAYRLTHSVKPTTKPQSVNERASRIMAGVKVRARVNELRAQLEAGMAKKQLWTREMSVRALITAYRIASPGVKVAAVRELNLMHGFNAPVESNVNVKGSLQTSGVLLMPAPMDPDEWEKQVIEQQADLMRAKQTIQ